MEDISPYFVHAVLAHEDAGFFSHHGFSEMHIRSALIRNLQEGRYVVGASTITMQLVKNVFLHREKTLARKIQEVLLTWWIERVMPKRDILELYLNVIEYGPGIYGIRRGARHYFNRLPAQLSPAELLAQQWRERLATNTMTGGKSADTEESRWRAAEQEVRSAQAQWARFGPLPAQIAAPLNERSTAAAVVGDSFPERFAEGAASGRPAARISSSAS